ncbi:hypothetical protein [Natrononativus amylolyticus]|uniref:hypothetical protein n=1 Tax=Natrononativus amylolyticus TaxID=2963434 RepID=UPI0020CD83F5|nr:hypothetical protein [Natrononativus amylolyticus]
MIRVSGPSLAAGAVGGLANAGVVLALYARGGYPALESIAEIGSLAATAFALGFAALFVSAHTRLVSPALGFFAALAGATSLELTSPMPEWSELGEYVIVEGPIHAASYANTWYVWFALLLVAGTVEFAVRRGYGIGDRRLRHLPALPLSRPALVGTVLGASGLVGAATTALVIRSGIRPTAAALVVFVVATAVAAVPLAALLARGLLAPAALFAALVPYFLAVEVFVTTDSPVHILLFGPYAVVLVAVWALEAALRSRLRGWDGGRFVGREPV